MGLAENKRRRKLGTDPNNTKWARKSDSFGQRILRSHGWEPGQYLGVQDAPHAALHTAANASHIRVVLRQDNLGIGAKQNGGDECTGLDAFQDLLGRLNGKDPSAVERERRKREELKLNLYVQRKLGTMNFVAGGLLVGDSIQVITGRETQPSTEAQPGESEYNPPSRSSCETDGEDREAEIGSSTMELEPQEDEKRKRKENKKRRKRSEMGGDETPPTDENARQRAKRRQLKPQSRNMEMGSTEPSQLRVGEELLTISGSSLSGEVISEADRKARRKARKEKKRSKTRDQADLPDGKEMLSAVTSSSCEDEKLPGDQGPHSPRSATSSTPRNGSITPVGSGASTPSRQMPSRHISRQKFIAQKRLAVLDPQALNQIFMIKSETSR